MIGNRSIKNNRGVTLMELVVSMAIFMVIMLAATGIFRMVIEGQRNAIAGQNVQENMRYALEVMSKEMRMALPNDGVYGVCNGRGGSYTPSTNVFNTDGVNYNVIYFVNKDGACTTYELVSGRIQVTRKISGVDYTDFLTPAKINIQSLKFNVSDNVIWPLPANPIQPKVKMLIIANMVTGKSEHQQSMRLQTTISSRVY